MSEHDSGLVSSNVGRHDPHRSVPIVDFSGRLMMALRAPIAVGLCFALIITGLPLDLARRLELGAPGRFSTIAAAASAATTTRASVNSSGAAGTARSLSMIRNMSDDARYVVFSTDSSNFPGANGIGQIYLRDRTAGSTTLVSVNAGGTAGNGYSNSPQVSGDGRYVAFGSDATDLVPGTSGQQVFVRDLLLGTTIRVWDGLAAADTFHLSANAPLVSFIGSSASVFVQDLGSGSVTNITAGANRGSISSWISANGQYVAFSSSATNLAPGVPTAPSQVHIYRASSSGGGFTWMNSGLAGEVADDTSYNPTVANDGSVIYATMASNVGARSDHSLKFVRSQGAASTYLGGGGSNPFDISADGRFVSHYSPNDCCSYLLDTQTGLNELISVSTLGEAANGVAQRNGAVTPDGHYVAFASTGTNVTTGKANSIYDFDIFVRDRGDRDLGANSPYTFGNAPHMAFSRDPVNLATGVFVTEAVDLAMPGRVLSFSFARTYNSSDALSGPLGGAWTHSYNWRITDGDGFVDLRRGDGRRDQFTLTGPGQYAMPPGVFDALVKNVDKTYTLTLVNQVKYHFGTNGALTKISEPAGNQLTLSYSGSNLTSITDASGRAVSLGYDASNRLTSIQDPLGRRVTYAYDGNGRLSTVTDKIGNATGQDPLQHRWQYGYAGTTLRLTTITDPDGRIRATNVYDAQGRVSEQRDGINALTTFAYTSGQTVVTDPRLHATTYTFDGRMRVLSQTDVVGANTYTVSYTYDAAGNRDSATDRANATTAFTFDTRGNALTKTDPQVDPQIPRYVTQYQYDLKNNLTQITDPRNFVTTMAYDVTTNVLLSVTRQIDATTSAITKYEYGDATNPGLPSKVIAPRGNTIGTPDYAYATSLTYDSRGNLITRIDPDAAKTTYAYDAAGRMTSFVDPDGYALGAAAADHTWTIATDENDQEKTRTDPLGKSVGYGYDGAGNRTTTTDRNGNVTTQTYDANARLETVKQKPDPLANPTLVYTTAVTRDGNGNASRVTQGNAVVTDYGFDVLDRMTSVTSHPDAVTNLVTSYVLDGNGNVLTKTGGDATVVTNTYDALNRLKSVAATGLATITYAYDPSGNRTQMIDATGTTTYQYDGLGRMTQAAQPGGTLGYAYDRDGNRTSLVYPGASGTVAYVYTPGGRLDRLTDWAGRLSSYTYTAAGLVSSLQYPNGMKATYGHDRAQRLTMVLTASGSATIDRQLYTLDAEGNRTSINEYVEGLTAMPLTTWTPSVKVNSDAGTTVQDHPAIAIGADAATYLIWDDARSGNADIEFARRDPVTGIWGANVKVNTDAGTRPQLNPALALDASSNTYAVWDDQRDGPNNKIDRNVYFAKRAPGAPGTWSANVRLNTDTTGNPVQRNPRISANGPGTVSAVWVDLRSSQQNIQSRRSTDGAATWSANLQVTDNTAALKDLPDVAVGADGTSYAVWQDSRNGNADVFVSKLPSGASAWTANVKVSDDPGTAAQTAPRIGIDGAGNVIVVWLDARTTPATIRMSRQLAGTSTWTPSTVVTDAAARPLSVALAVRADGKAQVAFGDNRGSSADVYRTELDPWLESWSTSTLVSDDPGSAAQQAPAVAYSSSEVFAAWRDDRAGNADVRARQAALTGGTDSFSYSNDGLNRLTAVAGPVAESFTLDASTNIASRTGPSATYTYDTSNRVTSDGAQAFTWNNADRLTGRGADSFGYDPLGRLVTSTTSAATRTFTYSGDGLLQSATGGSATSYLWDTSVHPASLVTAGNETVVYGLGAIYTVRADGTTNSFARDGLGSVRAEVDQLGAVTKAFRYRAYGTVATSSAGTPTLLGYAGELGDANGLIYLRARWYDPAMATFMSRDPLMGQAEQPASLNGFIYAARRPTLLVDPSGLDPVPGARSDYRIGNIRVVGNAQGFLGFMVTAIGGCCHPQSTVTFGAELIVSTGAIPRGSALLAHELAHVNQARQLGIWYLPAYIVTIPFTIAEHGLNFHDSHPAELNANAKAGLLPTGVPPPGWQYPWSLGK